VPVPIYEEPTGTFTRYLTLAYGEVYVNGVSRMIELVVDCGPDVDAIALITPTGETQLVRLEEDDDSDGRDWTVLAENRPGNLVIERISYVDATWDIAEHEVFVDGFGALVSEHDG
jgi:hypothetical protein